MATTDLGACEWFVWDLRRSNLINRGQLDQVVGEFLKNIRAPNRPNWPNIWSASRSSRSSSPIASCKGRPRASSWGRIPSWIPSAPAAWVPSTRRSPSRTTSGTPSRCCRGEHVEMCAWPADRAASFESFNQAAIVPFVDVGTSGGLHYLAWPLVEGESMESVLQREGKMAPDVAVYYVLQVAQGLNVCHQHGIFHGLLKPSNLMLDSNGQVHILDFGIGSLLAENEGESLVDTMSTANTLTSGLDCASPESIMEPTTAPPPATSTASAASCTTS